MYSIKSFHKNTFQNRRCTASIFYIFLIMYFIIILKILQWLLNDQSVQQTIHTTKAQYLNNINELLLSIPTNQQNEKTENFTLENDFSKLINLNDFNFTINQKQCVDNAQNKLPFTLILIHSAPNNLKKRNVIRETWGDQLSHNITQFRIIFLLGTIATSPASTKLQNKLEEENVIYQDIVQGNFIDTYYNLTYKHIMAFKWFNYYCSNANYLLKTDDDVFINAPMFHQFINAVGNRQLLFCKRREKDPVRRSHRSKWYVSTKTYSDRYWPNYCPGFVILYSSDITLKLYNEAQKNQFLTLDDVFVTGILSQKSNITITSFETFFISEQIVNELINRKRNMINTYFLFSDPTNLNEFKIRTLSQLTLGI